MLVQKLVPDMIEFAALNGKLSKIKENVEFSIELKIFNLNNCLLFKSYVIKIKNE